MKVKNLLEALKGVDPEASVFIQVGEYESNRSVNTSLSSVENRDYKTFYYASKGKNDDKYDYHYGGKSIILYGETRG